MSTTQTAHVVQWPGRTHGNFRGNFPNNFWGWRSSRGIGFTLVELLVVVAIISLLLAILLPAMNKAKEQAVSTVCSANLRSLGLALQSFASEHRRFPVETSNIAGSDPEYNQYYDERRDMTTTDALDKNGNYVKWWRDLFNDPKPGQVACPVGSKMKTSNLRRMHYNVNYHMVYTGGGTNQLKNLSKTISRFSSEVSPALRVVFWDGANTWNHANTEWDYVCADGTNSHLGTTASTLYDPDFPMSFKRISRIHMEGTNMVFWDGHASFVPHMGDDLPYYRPGTAPNNGTVHFNTNNDG